MLKLREKLAFGNQVDYFDDPNCIGWVLTGDYEHELSGLAVVMTNAQGAEKRNDHQRDPWWRDLRGYIKE